MLSELKNSRWHLHHGDSIEHMPTLPDACMDFAIFSPPFPAMYAYTGEASDVGNSEDFKGDAKLHLSFFFKQFARLLKPGRAVIVHCMQLPRLKRSGEVGLHDFRGLNIRLGERSGLVYEYDWMVRKNPQAQAIRSRSRELQFVGLEKDRAACRGTLADYLIKFRAPGENQVPVSGSGQVSRNDWISWAESCWSDIRETDTLNVAAGRDEKDTKHICPLQLEVIERCIRLYTNPDEVVFSPFAGIGSEGHVALRLGRKFYGCELKDSYVKAARRTLAKAVVAEKKHLQLFDV